MTKNFSFLKGIRFSLKLFLLILLIIFFTIPYINCKRKAKDAKFFRFIDHLSEKNIISTPLRNLGKRFGEYTQKLEGEWVDFTDIFGGENYNVWGISTKYPILGLDDSKQPEDMKIFKTGKEIDFLSNLGKEKEGWKWIKCEKSIIIKKWFYRKEQISGKTFFATDIILPEGEVMFEILASNRHPNRYSPNLKIALNQKIIGNVNIGQKEHYKIYSKVNIGKYRLRLFFEKTPEFTKIKQEDIELYINRIRLKGLKDIVLIYSSNEFNYKSSDRLYTASYIKEPTTVITKNGKKILGIKDLSLRNLYSLYKFNVIKTYNLEDHGINENSYNIKKKLILGEDSINILFAPTQSRFMFDFKVPERGIIEFGYGIFSPGWKKDRNVVVFKIMIESKGKKEILFSKYLNPQIEKQNNIVFNEKISLSSYYKKKIRLYLITQNYPLQNKEKKFKMIHYSFWYNPIIYQSSDDKRKSNNVILISLDTLRAEHLGCYGYKKETSPNLDKFVDDSVIFLNCFSTAPSTLRAHMSLMTALNPIGHQVYTQLDKLNPQILTLADILRVNGYLCAAFTGGARVSTAFGFSKGFDHYHENRSPWLQKDTPEQLLKKSLQWLERNRNKKFFLFLHTYQPHDPYWNDSAYGQFFLDKNDKWKRIELFKYLSKIESLLPFSLIPLPEEERNNLVALYDGEIRYTDECLIKPLIIRLKKLELYNNTMIIITSDHGEEFYEHGMWMHGGQLYNELIKIPLIIKFPKSKYKGKRVKKNVRIIDILPTVLKELNIDYSILNFDGKDLFPLIQERKDAERICYAEIPIKGNLGKISVIYKNYKLILNRIIHKDKFKDQAPPEELELYNLKVDPMEKNNLANEDKQMVKYLLEKIEQYSHQEKRIKFKRTEKPIIDKELEERLKALGYIE